MFQVWFQNHRAKYRRLEARSGGGAGAGGGGSNNNSDSCENRNASSSSSEEDEEENNHSLDSSDCFRDMSDDVRDVGLDASRRRRSQSPGLMSDFSSSASLADLQARDQLESGPQFSDFFGHVASSMSGYL